MKFEKRRKGKKIFREKIGVNPVEGEEKRGGRRETRVTSRQRYVTCVVKALL